MALSCPAVFTRLSLLRLSVSRVNPLSSALYSHQLSSPQRYVTLVPPLCRWSLCRRISSSGVRPGLGRYWSKLQSINSRYERFLQKRFPRFYVLYHTFVEGFKLLFRDAKEVSRIKAMARARGLAFQDLTYREMETLRQFRRDVIKAVPLVLISIPPFANYLVFVLMYLFPRQLLIPHFWTPSQRLEFRRVYQSLRRQHHRPLLDQLHNSSRHVRDPQMKRRLQQLCSKAQAGARPQASEVLAVRSLFSGPPLGIGRLSADQMRLMSQLLFLTPRLPSFLLGLRLDSHGRELLQLDRALSRLGIQNLSQSELQQACFLRGLNADQLSVDQSRAWLHQWLEVSTVLKDAEVSLLLHNMLFFSLNKRLQ
ncbi:LOW QUALITY PROTEIN: LETM1 domain-containing protein 1 [Synchiropus picturatus]